MSHVPRMRFLPSYLKKVWWKVKGSTPSWDSSYKYDYMEQDLLTEWKVIMYTQTNGSVIVLNLDYTFMNLVSMEKAFSYISRGKVTVEKESEKVLTSDTRKYIVPKIVRFTYIVKELYTRKVPWSKRNVCIRDHYKCAYCGVVKKKMTVDHVIPKAQGGKNAFTNAVCSCFECNNKKGNRTPRESGMYPSHNMVQPTIMEFTQQWYKQLDIDHIVRSIWE